MHDRKRFLLAALVIFGAAPAGAQALSSPATQPVAQAATPPGNQAGAKPSGRPDRTIERIRIEDAGSRIDELRVGGETQSITVQPAADVPAYEIRPPGASGAADAGSMGSRVWNILKF